MLILLQTHLAVNVWVLLTINILNNELKAKYSLHKIIKLLSVIDLGVKDDSNMPTPEACFKFLNGVKKVETLLQDRNVKQNLYDIDSS